ncbi:hypothetical protein GVAV_002645 [Gurleya vavrai]
MSNSSNQETNQSDAPFSHSTDPSVPNKSPTKQDITATKKGKFPWTYFLLSVVGIPLLAFCIGKYYFSFRAISPFLFKDTFYAWRILHADRHMYSQTWKYIPENRYKKDGDYAKFVDLMQTKGLIFDGHPEHFPRGFKHYDSHFTDHQFNKNFLKLRKELSETFDEALNNDVKTGKAEFSDKKIMFWNGKKVDKEKYQEILDRHEDIKYFMTALYSNFLVKLYEKDGYQEKVDKDTPTEMVDDIKLLCDLAKVETKKEFIGKMPVLLGKADTPLMVNFVYSRIFYLFYFYTLDCEVFEEGEKSKKGDARISEVSRCFATLIGEMFKYDYKEIEKQEGKFFYYLRKAMGPQKTAFIDKKETIKKLMDSLKEKLDLNESIPAGGKKEEEVKKDEVAIQID